MRTVRARGDPAYSARVQRRPASVVFRYVALALGAAAAAVACVDQTYLFLGRRYAPGRDCLDTTTAMDVMAGADPGNCEARCVSGLAALDASPALPSASGDGGKDIYVTVMCPPLPHGVDAVDPNQPACVKALAALARKNTCLGDGGVTAPLDASSD